jgi:glutamyl-tRNA synthetase
MVTLDDSRSTSTATTQAGSSAVVTRFAPSPTGYLHIGGARTALFNFLFARHHGGSFRLRIEDTDRERSVPAAVDAIFDGLSWLGLAWDGDVVHQFSRKERHADVARQLVTDGQAYFCYASADELAEMRTAARAAGKPMLYDGRWRERPASDAPAGVNPVIRLKAPHAGETAINDLVQGRVVVANAELDDMVLLRSDGTPTYMLAVVVDDHDMGVTHVLRGDDHLNNAFRQLQLIRALGWPEPVYGHIPLIHGEDGHKLSKRHGAVGLQEYRDMGLLPEAVENYLLRLGWGHGDDEIISRDQAIAWFDSDGIGRSPSRLDMKKLENLNAHYLRTLPAANCAQFAAPFIAREIGRPLTAPEIDLLTSAVPDLAQRAKTLRDIAQGSAFLFANRPLTLDAAAAKAVAAADPALLDNAVVALAKQGVWSAADLDALLKETAVQAQTGIGKLLMPLRAALTGTTNAPGVASILSWLGKHESLARLQDQFQMTGMTIERATG